MFEQSKWIWLNNQAEVDEYVEFVFTVKKSDEKAICRLSCDGDYTLFIGGKYVSSNQYGDFEHYKIYDEIDITCFLESGENEVKILVWHQGVNTSRARKATAGLIFEIEQGGKIVAVSDENTLCRKNLQYKNGYCKWVTPQIGFSFYFDATKENGAFAPAVCVDKKCKMFPRPIERLTVEKRVKSTVLKNEGNYYLIDLGRESVGLPVLEFETEEAQYLRVDWGEDLQEDGHVRRILIPREFSFEYMAKAGVNEYTNYMLRVGGRYLEIFAEKPIKLNYAGILPQNYAVKEKEKNFKNPLDKKIYDVCVRTLKLCMMEHYVDTPWREQAFYVLDSRNQMLCGYYAFENGNARYVKGNLALIAQDTRLDGLLSICYPCGDDLSIPSFSLHYFTAVKEYIEHTNDTQLPSGVFEKLKSLIAVFLKNEKDGLLCRFEGTNHWNFYDHSQYSGGRLTKSDEPIPDLLINCLFIRALEAFGFICEKLNKPFEYGVFLENLRVKTRKAFFRKESGLFSMLQAEEQYTQIGNAMAILCGLTDKMESETIAQSIISGALVESSLSTKGFIYDALLQTNEKKYKPLILLEIRTNYKKMLDKGATSVWETLKGSSDFGNAGSLCHGWSALPVYYFHKLKV